MSRITLLPPDGIASAEGVKPAGWWHDSDDHKQVVCDLCPRGCSLREGNRGFCFVRQNLQGQMVTTTYGRSSGFCIDPIEKKPLNHFYPGSSVLSFGTAGCNLGCKFCQNWEISKSREVDALGERADPETVARAARQLGCQSVAFTYNDPVVWAEYAIDCAKACRAAGVKTVAVTAGYIAPAARKPFFEAMDAANVDLKGFSEDFYRDLTSSHLAPVQETIEWLVRESNVWLEVTNLLIPGRNDSAEELKRMCAWFVEAAGPDVPLHFTAFHPDFRMPDVPSTPLATLVKAHEIARSAGLKYVYTGNTSDRTRQSTYCPGCGHVLVGRDGYHLSVYGLKQDRCGNCSMRIAGRFGDGPGDWGARRLPVRISEYGPAQKIIVGQGNVGQVTNLSHVDVELFALTPDQERVIFQATGRRLMQAVLGQAPDRLDQSLAGLARMPVAGTFVTLKRSGALRSCCGSLGQAVPLSMAIEHAVLAAAKDDPRFPPLSPVELPHLSMDVWLLGKMEPVLAKASDRSAAVVIGKHGLQISKGNRRGLLLPAVAVEHHVDAVGFLELVCRKAGLPADAWKDDDTALMTFEGRMIEGELNRLELPVKVAAPRPGPRPADMKILVDAARQNLHALLVGATPAAERIAVASVPAPRAGTDIRLPAVAGMFYPRHADEIARTLDEWFAHKPEAESWAGAMVPHAGWVYSGRLAAEVFSRVKFPKQVIMLAPRHRPEGARWAVAPHRTWQLPGGCLDSDPELARLLAASIPGLELEAAAHVQEHAIEVQLPLIARLSPHSRVVGITIHSGELEDLQRFGQQMADVLAGLSERPLLVISSDMNHFADDGETRRRDRMALEAIAALDARRLYRTVRDNRISMCGVLPAVVVLTALGCLHALNRCCEVGYTTSATVSHDTQRCVGYAGMLFA